MADTDFGLPKIEEDHTESNNPGGIATYSAKKKTTVKQVCVVRTTSVDSNGKVKTSTVVEERLSSKTGAPNNIEEEEKQPVPRTNVPRPEAPEQERLVAEAR